MKAGLGHLVLALAGIGAVSGLAAGGRWRGGWLDHQCERPDSTSATASGSASLTARRLI